MRMGEMWGLKPIRGSVGEDNSSARTSDSHGSAPQLVERIIAESTNKRAVIERLYSHAVESKDSRDAIIKGMESYASKLPGESALKQIIGKEIERIETITMLEMLKGV